MKQFLTLGVCFLACIGAISGAQAASENMSPSLGFEIQFGDSGSTHSPLHFGAYIDLRPQWIGQQPIRDQYQPWSVRTRPYALIQTTFNFHQIESTRVLGFELLGRSEVLNLDGSEPEENSWLWWGIGGAVLVGGMIVLIDGYKKIPEAMGNDFGSGGSNSSSGGGTACIGESCVLPCGTDPGLVC